MEYSGAVVLGLVSLMLIGTVRPYRNQWPVLAALVFVVLGLHVVSIANVLVGPLPGAQWDASTFHRRAVETVVKKGELPELSIGTELYGYILASVYTLFEPHKLVGQSLSIVAATGTLLCANAMAIQLGVRGMYARAGMLLVVGLYPTFLFHNALTFREPYELIGFALGIFFMLKAIDERRILWLIAALASFLFMGGFHHILLGAGIVVACIGVVFIFRSEQSAGGRYGIGVVLLIAIVSGGYFAAVELPATKGNDYIKELHEQGGVVEAIENYRNEIERESPRTSYGKAFDTSNTIALLRSAVMNYWSYLSQPAGRVLETPADVVPYLSALVRMLLIGLVVWLILMRRPVDLKLVYCGITYLVLTGVWSIGTTNYGQAFRHHSLTDWLLVVMASTVFSRQPRSRCAGPASNESK